MTVITHFPQGVREIENTWITLQDGCRLAAKIWMPDDAEQNPVPAILEYLPYRKRDGTHERDALTYPYFAGHGYAGVRVDIRGNGESDGVMHDEYLIQEQDDAIEVIEWLVAQPWCDGRVGMMGISWGGFNSLQVAARRPAALKAIISLCSTDNRYTDDIHYKGGALLMENLGWASTMLSYSSRPPDPMLRPDDWEQVWLHRLEKTPLLVEKWLQHPDHDHYWKHGSIDENYGDIEASTLLIGGWHDAYSNTIPRMLEHLQCPKQGIIGPWAHKYPHFAVPEPRVGFLQLATRWWDRWLKDIDNGADEDPLMRVYVMDSVPPRPSYCHRPGRWVAEDRWPSGNVDTRGFYLSQQTLAPKPGAPNIAHINSPEDTGTAGGEFCIMWLGPDWPTDQQDDDANSLTYDSPVLTQSMVLLGAPELSLQVSGNAPGGVVVARLCDIDESGLSTLISLGVRDLAHRKDMERQTPVIPGRAETVRFKLDDCGYTVPAGHRLRLSIATAHWPVLWPSAFDTTLSIHEEASKLELPIYRNTAAPAPSMPDSLICQPCDQQTLLPPDSYRKVTRDAEGTLTRVEVLNDFGKTRSSSHQLETQEINHELHQVRPGDPLSARSLVTGSQLLQRDDWQVRTETSTEMWCDREYYFIRASLKAFKAGDVVFERHWDTRIARFPGHPAGDTRTH